MKTIAIIILATLCSCTVAHIQSPAGGQATFASLGGDSQDVKMSPESLAIGSNKNSASFKNAATAGVAATGIIAAASVSKTELLEAGDTDRAAIGAATQQAGMREATTRALSSDGVRNLRTQAVKEVKLAEIAKPPVEP